jgi:hypothetical protein
MKKILRILSIGLLAAGAAQADTISFAALNGLLSGNTLNVGGNTADLTVTGVSTNNNYRYSVSYTGADYDGDNVNDTLSFDVLVQGWIGSSASTTFANDEADVNANNGTATIGTTNGAVSLTAAGNFSVDSSTMNEGKTLEFSLDNFLVTGTTIAGTYTASLDAFTGASYSETGKGYGHIAVIGEGPTATDLFASRFNATTYNIDGLLNETDTLLITSASLDSINATDDLGDPATTLPSSNPQRWNVLDVDFGVTVIPEPATLGLVATFGFGVLIIRRRFMV